MLNKIFYSLHTDLGKIKVDEKQFFEVVNKFEHITVNKYDYELEHVMTYYIKDDICYATISMWY